MKSPASLDYLVAGYGTHGFVIDIDECRELFRNVRGPTFAEQALCEELGSLSIIPVGAGLEFVGFVSDTIEEGSDAPEHAENGNEA